ncbi:hypothetical protein [Novosphingobium sp. KN65.2]|uniref:hypothetical protein n=1 Tax=Novosphingobium sp. KN65.2 TaxID=1478134 RepID=UPI0005E45A2B|nr:hypothetical protein [Novosphingobium sp. KN65.2]CDO36254.1 hypothetical protein SPHV1_2300057 [Novosphingobium sp. KN65.2]
MRSNRKTTSRLSQAAARRQGEVTQFAITVLGREAAIEFMNANNAMLGARPIDLVVASDAGRALVEGALSETSSRDAAPERE